MNSRPVKRIEDVMALRIAQFTEDSGPLAHPIRPDSYIKMVRLHTCFLQLLSPLLGNGGEDSEACRPLRLSNDMRRRQRCLYQLL